LEYAGDGLAWALTIDPADGVVYVIRATDSKNTTVALEVRNPMTLYDTHLTLFDDGVLGFWTPDNTTETDLLLVDSSNAREADMVDALYILPLNQHGFPRLIRPTSVIFSGGALQFSHMKVDSVTGDGLLQGYL